MIQKLCIQLKASDYDASSKSYRINLANQPFNAVKRVTIESVSLTSGSDSEYVLVSSKKLQNLARNKSATTNGAPNGVCYTLHPEFRVVRTQTSSTTTTTGVSDDLISDIGSDLILWWDMNSSRHKFSTS